MIVQLRPYQREAIDATWAFMRARDDDPIIVLPTGSGKSLVGATMIREACETWPGTRVVVVTHVKELLQQNARALTSVWQHAPFSFYSAGLGQKRTDQITFAGIQSAHGVPGAFGMVDLVIVDEAHLVPKKAEGTYRAFLDGLRRNNPYLRIVGMTATPYRLDSGLLHDGDNAIFGDIAYTADIANLVAQGFLCPLVSRAGAAKADLSAVRTRNGEFVQHDAAQAFMAGDLVGAAVSEVIALAGDRKSWLLFCSDVEHSKAVATELARRGIPTGCVTGETSSGDRAATLNAFKTGRLRAVTNCEVLTTGFDAPGIDLIVMLRPTKSTGLYVQMLGRGLRIAPSKSDTLVLDYAGNIERHGPIDQIRVRPKRAPGEGGGITVAPVKECPECHAFVAPATMKCACGYEWPAEAPHGDTASDAPVLAATHVETLSVDSVSYHAHDKPGSPVSLRVTYWCGARSFSEWVCLEHSGYAQKKAVLWFWDRGMTAPATVADALQLARNGAIRAPDMIVVKPDGKYWRVVSAKFVPEKAAA